MARGELFHFPNRFNSKQGEFFSITNGVIWRHDDVRIFAWKSELMVQGHYVFPYTPDIDIDEIRYNEMENSFIYGSDCVVMKPVESHLIDVQKLKLIGIKNPKFIAHIGTKAIEAVAKGDGTENSFVELDFQNYYVYSSNNNKHYPIPCHTEGGSSELSLKFNAAIFKDFFHTVREWGSSISIYVLKDTHIVVKFDNTLYCLLTTKKEEEFETTAE